MNKRVLITGGARGLGRAIAIEAAKHQYEVAITYLTSSEEANELKMHIENEYNVGVSLYKVDLSNEQEVTSLVKKIGDIDVLVNNVAYNHDCPLFDKSGKEFRKTLEVNLVAPFLLSLGFYEILKKRKGNIVNIVSTNGIDTMYEESIDYDASKAALINLTKSLSAAFKGEVRVNAVAPGWIDTEGTRDMEGHFRSFEEEKSLAGRFAKPEEIAKAVFFVAGENASYMNGSILRIDGGRKYGNR